MNRPANPRYFLLFLNACLLLTFVAAASLWGQTPHASSSMAVPAGTESTDLLAEDLLALDGPETSQKGFNASAAFNGLYDTQLGWASFVQPAISYRFNPIFSVDGTIPIYFYRLGYRYRPGKPTTGPLTPHSGELGDTTLAGHLEFSPGLLDDTFTAAINAPTGDTTFGLSTGRVTYLIMNDFEATVKQFTPDLQFGIGDSSSLVNRRVVRNYDTLGTLAYFQGGGLYHLRSRFEIESDLYEQLPLGKQKIYTQVVRIKHKKVIQKSSSNAEDNGITVNLDMPAKRHIELSAFFNRSFRLADSTAGVALTFWLKNP